LTRASSFLPNISDAFKLDHRVSALRAGPVMTQREAASAIRSFRYSGASRSDEPGISIAISCSGLEIPDSRFAASGMTVDYLRG